MRSASRASPRTASTAGPGLGLPRLGRLEGGVGLPDQAPGGFERLARGDPVPGRGGVVVDLGGDRGQAAGRVGGGTDPAALRSTTVATRASRLPRLLARSAL